MNPPLQTKRIAATVVAFLLAPLVPPMVLAILSPLVTDIGSFLKWTSIFYFYSALATTIFGIPVFLALRQFKLINVWTAILSGFFIGLVVAVCLHFPPLPAEAIRMAVLGAIATFVFWAIWRTGHK